MIKNVTCHRRMPSMDDQLEQVKSPALRIPSDLASARLNVPLCKCRVKGRQVGLYARRITAFRLTEQVSYALMQHGQGIH